MARARAASPHETAGRARHTQPLAEGAQGSRPGSGTREPRPRDPRTRGCARLAGDQVALGDQRGRCGPGQARGPRLAPPDPRACLRGADGALPRPDRGVAAAGPGRLRSRRRSANAGAQLCTRGRGRADSPPPRPAPPRDPAGTSAGGSRGGAGTPGFLPILARLATRIHSAMMYGSLTWCHLKLTT